MKTNKAFAMLTTIGLMAFNAIRTIENKFLAWKNRDKITMQPDYKGGGNGSEGS